MTSEVFNAQQFYVITDAADNRTNCPDRIGRVYTNYADVQEVTYHCTDNEAQAVLKGSEARATFANRLGFSRRMTTATLYQQYHHLHAQVLCAVEAWLTREDVAMTSHREVNTLAVHVEMRMVTNLRHAVREGYDRIAPLDGEAALCMRWDTRLDKTHDSSGLGSARTSELERLLLSNLSLGIMTVNYTANRNTCRRWAADLCWLTVEAIRSTRSDAHEAHAMLLLREWYELTARNTSVARTEKETDNDN